MPSGLAHVRSDVYVAFHELNHLTPVPIKDLGLRGRRADDKITPSRGVAKGDNGVTRIDNYLLEMTAKTVHAIEVVETDGLVFRAGDHATSCARDAKGEGDEMGGLVVGWLGCCLYRSGFCSPFGSRSSVVTDFSWEERVAVWETGISRDWRDCCGLWLLLLEWDEEEEEEEEEAVFELNLV